MSVMSVLYDLTDMSPEVFAFLIAMLVKGLAVFVVAVGINLLLRKASASARHIVWVLAFAAVSLLPLLILTVPSVGVPVLPVHAVEVAVNAGPVEPVAVVKPVVMPGFDITAMPQPRPAWGDMSRNDMPEPAIRQRPEPVAAPVVIPAPVLKFSVGQYLLIVWAAGVVFCFVPICLRLLALLRFQGRCKKLATGPAYEMVGEVARQLKIRRAVRVIYNDDAGRLAPMVWGVTPPILFLPGAGKDWTDQQLRSVLLHELAHIRRHDWLTQLFCGLVAAAYWFNPLTWYGLRRIRVEREQACDDLVLNSGIDSVDYAGHLVKIARNLVRPLPVNSAALAMARHNQIESRIKAILDLTRNRRAVSKAMLCVFMVVVGVVSVTVAALEPVEKKIEPTPLNLVEALDISDKSGELHLNLFSIEYPDGKDNSTALSVNVTNNSDKATYLGMSYYADSGTELLGTFSPGANSMTEIKPIQPGFKGDINFTINHPRFVDNGHLIITFAKCNTGKTEGVFLPDSSEIIFEKDYSIEKDGIKASQMAVKGLKPLTFEQKLNPDYKQISISGPFIYNSGSYSYPEEGISLKEFLQATYYKKESAEEAYITVYRKITSGEDVVFKCYNRRLDNVIDGKESDIALKPGDHVGGGYIEKADNNEGLWGNYRWSDVIELTINDDGEKENFFADLDTGKLFTPAKDMAFDDKKAFMEWVNNNGIDVMGETSVSVNGLIGLNMSCALQVDNDLWDETIPELGDRSLMGGVDQWKMLSFENNAVSTYIIRTSNGMRKGVLQILDVTNNPRTIKLRYKLLKNVSDIKSSDGLLYEIKDPNSMSRDERRELEEQAISDLKKRIDPNDGMGLEYTALDEGKIAVSMPGNELKGTDPFKLLKENEIKVNGVINPHITFKHEERIGQTLFTSNGSWLITESNKERIKFTNTANGFAFQPINPNGFVNSMAISENGIYLAISTNQGFVGLWNTQLFALTKTFSVTQGSIYVLALSNDGKLLAGSTGEGTIQVWDTRNNKMLYTLGEKGDEIFSVAFSADGKFVVLLNNNGKVSVCNTTNGSLINSILVKEIAMVGSVTFRATDHYIVITAPDGIRFWDPIANGGIQWIKMPDQIKPFDFSNFEYSQNKQSDLEIPCYITAISQDCLTAAAAIYDGTIYIWDIPSRTIQYKLVGTRLPGNAIGGIQTIAFSLDKKLLSCGNSNGTVEIYQLPYIESNQPPSDINAKGKLIEIIAEKTYKIGEPIMVGLELASQQKVKINWEKCEVTNGECYVNINGKKYDLNVKPNPLSDKLDLSKITTEPIVFSPGKYRVYFGANNTTQIEIPKQTCIAEDGSEISISKQSITIPEYTTEQIEFEVVEQSNTAPLTSALNRVVSEIINLPAKGVLLLPDGKPSIDTELAIVQVGNGSNYPVIEKTKFRKTSKGLFIKTDNSGNFSFTPTSKDYLIVVVSPDGYAQVTRKEFEEDHTIKMQKWAQISGTLLINGVPGANQKISIYDSSIRHLYGPDIVNNITTDTNGNFTSNYLMAGKMVVSRSITANGSMTYTDVGIVTLVAGQMVKVVLGNDKGVSGKIKAPADYEGEINWVYDNFASLTFKPVEIKIFPDEYYTMSKQDRMQWFKKWSESEEGKAYVNREKPTPMNYLSVVADDGSFKFDSIPAGNYILKIHAYRKGDNRSSASEPIGVVYKEFAIEPKETDGNNLVFDLGELELKLKKTIEINSPAPVFTLKDLDGKEVKLSDYAGKFVLLDFRMSRYGGHISNMQYLKQVYNQYKDNDNFVLISVFFDNNPKAVKLNNSNEGIQWTQCIETAGLSSDVAADYGMYSQSPIHLIGPDGKFLAVDLSGDEIFKAVDELKMPGVSNTDLTSNPAKAILGGDSVYLPEYSLPMVLLGLEPDRKAKLWTAKKDGSISVNSSFDYFTRRPPDPILIVSKYGSNGIKLVAEKEYKAGGPVLVGFDNYLVDLRPDWEKCQLSYDDKYLCFVTINGKSYDLALELNPLEAGIDKLDLSKIMAEPIDFAPGKYKVAFGWHKMQMDFTDIRITNGMGVELNARKESVSFPETSTSEVEFEIVD